MSATIGLQLYTIRDDIAADPLRALERVAQLGFRSVEPYGLPALADTFVAGLAASGLAAPSAHASIIGRDPAAPPELRATLDAAERLGVRTVIEPSTPAAAWLHGDRIQRMADTLNAAAEAGADRGIRIGYHNHDGELRARAGGMSALEHFAGLLDPRIVLEIDAYWVLAGGEPLLPLLGRLADRIRFLHVKDGLLEGDLAAQPAAGTGAPPAHLAGQVDAGTGVVPLEEALAALPGLEHAIVEFDAYTGDLERGITAGRDFLLARGCTA